MNLERQIKDVEVGCFSFVFQTIIRHLFYKLSEVLNVKYIEYLLWIFLTAQVITCKMQEVDNKLNRYVNNAFRSVICHMNTVGV